MWKSTDELCGFISANAGLQNSNNLKMLKSAMEKLDHQLKERYLHVTLPRVFQLLVLPLMDVSVSRVLFQHLNSYRRSFSDVSSGSVDDDEDLVVEAHVLKLERSVIASLLAASFFGYFHSNINGTSFLSRVDGNAREVLENCPGMDFVELYTRPRSPVIMLEKLKCLLNYFDLIISSSNGELLLKGHVWFQRKRLGSTVPDFFSLDSVACVSTRCSIDIVTQMKIEDAPGDYEKVDFANCVVGGGVLGNGCVQEEILFLIYPELLVSRLFISPLGKRDSLIVKGARRYCNYSGYAGAFRFAGACGGAALMEPTVFIAIDALYFKNHGTECDLLCKQVEKQALIREMNKLYVGYSSGPLQIPLTESRGRKIATGNWGCGAFNGNVQLKFLLQLIVVSALGESIELRYCTFEHPDLLLAREIVLLLTEKQVSIQSLLKTINIDFKEHLLDMSVEQEDFFDCDSLDLFCFIYEAYS